MKNKRNILLIVLIMLLFFPFSVFALNLTWNVNVDSYFNFQKESRNNSEIYRYLINQGTNIISELNSNSSMISGELRHDLFIFKYVGNTIKIPESVDTNLLSIISKFNIPKNTAYVFLVNTVSKEHANSYLKFIYNNDVLSYELDRLPHINSYFYYFDNKMNYLKRDTYVNSYNTISDDFYIKQTYTSSESLQFMLNSFYYTDSDTSNYSGEDMRVRHIELSSGGQRYQLCGTGINLSSSDLSICMSAEAYGLEKYSRYYFASNGRIDAVYDSSFYNQETLILPDNFETITFNSTNKYYLIPISNTCSIEESYLYFLSSDKENINVINYNTISSSGVLENSKNYYFKLKRNNFLERLNPNIIHDPFYNTLSLVFSETDFSTNSVSYNPSCYRTQKYVKGSSLSFTDVNGNDILIDSNTQAEMINKSVSDSNSDLSDNNDSSNGFITLLKNGLSGIASLGSYIYKFGTLSFSFLSFLPQDLLIGLRFVWTMGLVIILFKIIKGGN